MILTAAQKCNERCTKIMNDRAKSLDICQLVQELNTDTDFGLSKKEARERLASALESDATRGSSYFVRQRRPAYACFFAILKMLPSILLLFVAVSAFFMGRAQLAVTVISTFVSGGIISGMLYLSAQRENERLLLYSNPTSRVLRDGCVYVTDSRNVVVGDIIELASGDYIPCDCRIIGDGYIVLDRIYGADGKVCKKCVGSDELDGILLAGSFVISGNARAVCYADGENTENHKFLGGGMLGEKNSDPKIVREAHGALYRWSTVLSVAALCFSTVGIFTASDVGILEVFLMLLSFMLSLTLVSSPIAGRILCASMQKKAAKSRNGADFAIIKNNSAMDELQNVTDILLLGKAPISDGELHYSSMLRSASVINTCDMSEDSRILLECAYAYVQARKEHFDIRYVCDELDGGIDGMLTELDFDRQRTDMKIKSLYYVKDGVSGSGYACIEENSESYRVSVTGDASVLHTCKKFRLHGDISDFTDGDVMLASNYLKDAESVGERVFTVISEHDGENVFEGMIGFCEREAQEYAEICDMLSAQGVKVTIMSDLCDNYITGCVKRLGIQENDIRFAHDGVSFCANGDAKAYLGYSADDAIEAVKAIHARGGRVAVCAIEDKYLPAMLMADVSVSYDNINYGSKKYPESMFPEMKADGDENGVRCSQRMRSSVSVIIGRTCSAGGGLRGLMNAMTTSQFFSFCYLRMVKGFVEFEIALALLIFFGAIFGISLISYPVILLLCVGVVFFSAAAYSGFKPRMLYDSGESNINKLFSELKIGILSPIAATTVYAVAAALLYSGGYIDGVAALPLSTLIAVILTLLWRFFGSMKLCLGKSVSMSDIKDLAERPRGSYGVLNMAAITLVISSVARMFLTALIFPSFNYEYGFNGFGVVTLVLLALYVAVFMLCELICRIAIVISGKNIK